MKNTTLCLILVFGLFLLSCFGQVQNASAKKPNAITDTKGYWTEFVSNECQFKILFPEKPTTEINQFGSTTIRDFKVTKANQEWSVNCSDDEHYVKDESLKDRYSQSIQALLKGSRKLLSKNDIYLDGKLGVEFVIEDSESISVTRAFLIQNRLYQIVFKENKKASKNKSANFSENGKTFFDSFIFWTEKNRKK